MLEENFRILQSSETCDGKKLTIYRIPVPDIEQLKFTQIVNSNNVSEFGQFGFGTGDTIYRVPAASYLNFFISNKVVLIPKYWNAGLTEKQKQKDEEAKNLFLRLFPGREIKQIYTLSINRGGGGIHCMTHEQPSILK
jgi:agmatine deiminase